MQIIAFELTSEQGQETVPYIGQLRVQSCGVATGESSTASLGYRKSCQLLTTINYPAATMSVAQLQYVLDCYDNVRIQRELVLTCIKVTQDIENYCAL